MLSNTGITPDGELIRSPYYLAEASLKPRVVSCAPKQNYTVYAKAVAPKRRTGGRNPKGEVYGLNEKCTVTKCLPPPSRTRDFTGYMPPRLSEIPLVQNTKNGGKVFNIVHSARRNIIDAENICDTVAFRNASGSEGKGPGFCGRQVGYPSQKIMVNTSCLEPFTVRNFPQFPLNTQRLATPETRAYPIRDKDPVDPNKCLTISKRNSEALTNLQDLNIVGRLGNGLTGQTTASGQVPKRADIAFSIAETQQPISNLNVENTTLL